MISEEKPAAPSRNSEVVAHTARVVGQLQAEYLPSGASRVSGGPGAARMAELRRADAADPSGSPAVWAITMVDCPIQLMNDGGRPSAAERAIHAAACLYARHQQSVPTSMNVQGRSLGRAVRDLVAARRSSIADEDGVRLRFQRVALSPEHAQRVRHLRGLVQLLRAERVPLDYPRLARDLLLLDAPASADRVRFQWGRDLYAGSSKNDGAPFAAAEPPVEPKNPAVTTA